MITPIFHSVVLATFLQNTFSRCFSSCNLVHNFPVLMFITYVCLFNPYNVMVVQYIFADTFFC